MKVDYYLPTIADLMDLDIISFLVYNLGIFTKTKMQFLFVKVSSFNLLMSIN